MEKSATPRCPEHVGFAEYIQNLKRELKEAREELQWHRDELAARLENE
jgi:ribosome-binding protein aMBF1 (putative translation factor)